MQSAPIAMSCNNRTTEVVFSVGSVVRLHHEAQWDKPVSIVVRETPAFEDLCQGAEEHPLLEDVTQQQ
jgi:hypothetical protein